MININSIEEVNDYIEFFTNLEYSKKDDLIDIWLKKIESGNHNNYELLTFFKITESLGVDTTDNVIETISFIDASIDEFDMLTDSILENYIPGDKRQESLLSEITLKIDECKLLKDFYKEKIIN